MDPLDDLQLLTKKGFSESQHNIKVSKELIPHYYKRLQSWEINSTNDGAEKMTLNISLGVLT